MTTEVPEKTETIAEQDQALYDAQQETAVTLDSVYEEMEKDPHVTAEDAEKTVTGRPRDSAGRYIKSGSEEKGSETEGTEKPGEQVAETPEEQGVEDSAADVPDDDESQEEATEETQAEETTPKPSPVTDIAEQDLRVARDWQMSDDEAKSFGTREALHKHIRGKQEVAEYFQQQQQAPPQQAPQQASAPDGWGVNEQLTNRPQQVPQQQEVVGNQQDAQVIAQAPDAGIQQTQPTQQPPSGPVQPFELNLPEDIDPALAEVMGKMNKHYAEQVQLLQQGQQESARQFQEATAKQQAEAEAQRTSEENTWLDDRFSQLSKQHGGAFGDGPYHEQSPEVQAARREVAPDYFHFSGPNPKDATAFSKAVSVSRFADSPTTQAVENLNGKVRQRAAQKLGSPQSRNVLDPRDTWEGDPIDDPISQERFASYEG